MSRLSRVRGLAMSRKLAMPATVAKGGERRRSRSDMIVVWLLKSWYGEQWRISNCFELYARDCE